MHTFKDALCLIGILIAYGIAGHLDFEDAQMLEEAQAPSQFSESSAERAFPVALAAAATAQWGPPAVSRAEADTDYEVQPAAPMPQINH